MKRAKIIKGNEADWDFHKEAQDNVAQDDGSINFGAAMLADPGVMSCPKCGEHYWREGELVECLDCHTQWESNK